MTISIFNGGASLHHVEDDSAIVDLLLTRSVDVRSIGATIGTVSIVSCALMAVVVGTGGGLSMILESPISMVMVRPMA